MKKNQMILGAVVLVVVAGVAFYSGDAYATNQASSNTSVAAKGAFTGAGGYGARGARSGGGFTAGKILSSGNGSISIQQQNGSSSEIVLVSPSTQILKSVSGASSDLTVGSMVTITGTSNSDGSLTATAIQIRPTGMGLGNRAQ